MLSADDADLVRELHTASERDMRTTDSFETKTVRSERRIRERRSLIYHLKVINQQTGKVVGYLGNLTTRGLLLFVEGVAQLNRDMPLEVLLPVLVNGRDRIAFEAAGVWSAPNRHPNLFSMGMRISHISRENLRLIGETLARFGSRA